MTDKEDLDAMGDAEELSIDVPDDVRTKKFWGYFFDYTIWFAAGAVFLILTNLQQLTIPVYVGSAVEQLRSAAGGELSLADARPGLVWAAVVIIALAAGGALTRILSRILIFYPGRYIEFDIRNELYEKLTELTPSFYGAVPTGDVTSRVTNDVQRVRVFYALVFLHLVNTGVAYIIGIWRMSQVSIELTLYCLAPYPFLLAGILWLGRALFYQTKVVQAQLSDISSKVQENLDGMSVVKSFVLEDREKKQFKELNDDFFGKNLRLAVIRGGLNALIGLVATVGTLMLLIIGTYQVIYGTLKLGQFVEFNGYVVQLAFPTIAMGWVFQIWYRGRAAFDRIVEILLREPELQDPPDQRRVSLPARVPVEEGSGTATGPATGSDASGDEPSARDALGEVEFNDVTFGYDDEPVLKDINLNIPAGSSVAFVGRTGSGKSTLVKLIGRLYDVDSGEVRLDGAPVDRVGLRELRAEIGFVPQEPFLFSMTLRQNIRFGLDALEYDESIERAVPTNPLIAPDDEHPVGPLDQETRIRQAVDVAGLRPDVDSFSDGLETLVGERGVTLSGGQKQRATLARAVLLDPRLLILDDALSSVDTQTEQVILDHLDYIMRDRTNIILTHRFNALDRVDRIYVMHEGRIVERGTHDELLRAEGHYTRMHRRQQLRSEAEGRLEGDQSDDDTDETQW